MKDSGIREIIHDLVSIETEINISDFLLCQNIKQSEKIFINVYFIKLT